MQLLFAVFLAATVKDGGAVLRDACDAEASVVAHLEAATEVTIRYSLSGSGGPCYKVAANVNGKVFEGYLPQQALNGTDAFDAARKQGGRISASRAPESPVAPAALPQPSPSAAPQIREAMRLMETGQAGRALQILEAELKIRRDPELLALAGAAAWRADEAERALQYWERSLELYPNPKVEALYKQVLQETRSDQSNSRMVGTKVLLRYEGLTISADTAREMVRVVDQAYARISSILGCAAEERVIAIAQSREAYMETTGAAEWSGGQFDGRIRVPVFDRGGLDEQTRRVLAHETVHACLAMLGHWPSWLHEGIAQRLSGETLAPAVRQTIEQLARENKLPRLEKLGESWSRLVADQAAIAYALALRAIEIFEQEMSAIGYRNLMKNPERLPQITAELNKRLGL